MFSNENKRKNNVFNVYNNVWKNDYLKSSLFNNNNNDFYDDYDSLSMSLTKQKSQINSMKFMYKNKKPFSNTSNKIKKKINFFHLIIIIIKKIFIKKIKNLIISCKKISQKKTILIIIMKLKKLNLIIKKHMKII